MAKNKQLIEFCKVLNARTADILPKLYSAFALALWEGLAMPEDEKVEAIKDVIATTQEIWQAHADDEIDILERCRELTGIEIMR